MRTRELCRRPPRHARVRTTAWTAAAAAAMVMSIAGSVSAGPADVSPQVRAMAQRLAQREPIQSCAADAPTMLPPAAMFAAGSPGVVSNPSLVGGPTGLWVQCSLAYTNGANGGDCGGKHQVDWTIFNGGAGQKVTAELLALDQNGNVLSSFLVNKGDQVQLMSRTNPGAWKFSDKNKKFEITAPVPLLKVKVEFNGDTAEAFCSNIPWVDVIQPSGGVVTDTTGGAIDFKAALPRTDPTQIHLNVDGADILPLVAAQHVGGLAACTFNAPCDGTLATTPPITYKHLIIDIASNIALKASNTISGSIEGLDCGGHFVEVTSKKDPAVRQTSAVCFVDDLADRGSASVFDIQLTELGGKSGPDLVEGLITTQIPTEVKGLICGGTDILSANVNGKELDVSGQIKTPGNGTTTGDLVTLNFDTFLDQTNLKNDVQGLTTTLDTFAPGSNRLLIAATEEQGTRAYERLIFAVGNNIKPLGVSATAALKTEVMESHIQEGLKEAIQAKMQNLLSPTETEIKNAFVVGLSANGAQNIMNNLCNGPIPGDGRTLGQVFHDAVSTELSQWTAQNPLSTFVFDPLCSCSATVPIFVDAFEVGNAFSCPIVFSDGSLSVTLALPDVSITLGAHKHQACNCPSNHTHVYAFIKVGLTDITFTYTITEADIKNETTTVGANPFQVGGQAQLDAGSEIDYGFLSDVCDFFVEGFVTLFTFGTVDIHPLLEPDFSISQTVNLTEALSPAQPNALPIKGFKIDQQVNNQFHQELSGACDAVSGIPITGPTGPGNEGAGITVGLKGTFATTSIDPLVEGNPGFQALEPSLPTMAQMQAQGAKDALVGLSSDSINMMFQSLGANGDMKVPGADAQGCFPLGANVGSLLPADCETIDTDPTTASPAADDVANGLARGYCHAIKGDNCNTLSFAGNPDVNLSSTERGVCDGASGATCSQVFGGDLVRLAACSITPNFNLHANQNIMFCAKADIPRMEFPVGAPAGQVPTDLQINDISVSLVLDRGPNGSPDNAVNGSLADLPGCFSGTQTGTDCNIFSACLDVNMTFNMNTLQPGNTVCEDGKPGFQASFSGLLPVFRKIGEVCAGGSSPTDDQDVLDTASNQDAVTKPIGENAAFFAPPICGAGLVTPLFTCDNVAILGLDVAADPNFKEFLAVTCALH